MCFDPAGNLYIADNGYSVIRKVDHAGIITTVAETGTQGYTGDNGPAAAANLHGPVAVVSDKQGNLYIGDNGTRIRKISTSGIITTIAGIGAGWFNGDGIPATGAALTVLSLAIDDSDNIFIGDQTNDSIRKVDMTTGLISTVAGSRTAGYSGDPVDLRSCSPQPTGIGEEATNNNIAIYPNPTAHMLQVKNIAPHSQYMVLNIISASMLKGIFDGSILAIIFQRRVFYPLTLY